MAPSPPTRAAAVPTISRPHVARSRLSPRAGWARHRGPILLWAAALGSIASVVLLMLAMSGGALAAIAGQWGQGLAELAGAVACALTAVHVQGRARLVWALLAAAQGIWAITDIAYGAVVLSGVEPPEVSPFDVGWLLFYAPALAAVGILYWRLRPERGWQGALDGLILVLALGMFAWVFLLEPVAAEGEGGTIGTVVAMLYPALDLAGVAAVGWLLLRHGRGMPRWLWWIVGAYGLQTSAGTAYLLAQLNGLAVAEAASAASYMLAGWLWVAAAASRRRQPERGWSPARQSFPPVWSRAIPFLLAFGMEIVSLSAPERRLIGLLSLVGFGLATVRVISTLVVNQRLIDDRERLLVVDPLTGAHSRRFFAEEIERAGARARRGERDVALIAFDLDRFKQVNDTYGHGTGDELLARVVTEAQGCLRAGDALCRLGGDEFVVLAPGAGPEGGLELAERLRAAVRAAGQALVPGIGVTASLGIASDAGYGLITDDLIRRADEALYVAKAAGRDRSVLFSESTPPATTPGGEPVTITNEEVPCPAHH